MLHGTNDQVHVSYRNRSGRDRSYYVSYEGVLPWIERRYAETESDAAREKYEGFMREVPCPACEGTRLKPEILAVTVPGRSIAELAALSIREAADWLRDARLTPRDRLIGERVLKEINARLGFLVDVGLRLPLPRPAGRHAGRRRGAADPAGHPDRLRPGRGALRAGRAVDRPAPARQPPADRDAGPAEGPGQHADRRRARRGHDRAPPTGSSTSARGPASTAARSS